MSIEEVRASLRVGDITYLQELTVKRKLNNGKGFTYDYVRRVFSENDTRFNSDVFELAVEYLSQRQKLEVVE